MPSSEAACGAVEVDEVARRRAGGDYEFMESCSDIVRARLVGVAAARVSESSRRSAAAARKLSEEGILAETLVTRVITLRPGALGQHYTYLVDLMNNGVRQGGPESDETAPCRISNVTHTISDFGFRTRTKLFVASFLRHAITAASGQRTTRCAYAEWFLPRAELQAWP